MSDVQPVTPPVDRETIRLEFTPNPATLKFVVSRPLLPRGTANFTDPAAATGSPLARRLFAVPGVTAVMIGPTFVTITRTPDADPVAIHDKVHDEIHAHVGTGEPAVAAEVLEQPTGLNDDPISHKIRTIIEEEVRPAVAMDGGDITFERFSDGVVYVWMKGSCSSCPSSTLTLKSGIETRLREEIPEVVEVVQI